MTNTMVCKINLGSFDHEKFNIVAEEINKKFYATATTSDDSLITVTADDGLQMQCALCILGCRLR